MTLTASSPTPPQPRQLFGYDRIFPIPKWVGRDELLTELHTELQNNRRMLVLCGQGGIGKTSLAVKLISACGVDVSQSVLSATCPYDNVLFYQVGESDSFESLVARFFDAFGLAPNSDDTPAQKIETIAQRLHQQRWLVVLDNLESLLEFDSAKSKSADVGNLLNSLAYGGHNSQVAITSRKFPEDLNDRRGRSPNPSNVFDRLVEGISNAASIELLQALGMRDSQADLEWIAGRVGGNIFILEQLASYARNKPGLLRNQRHLVTKEAKPIIREQLELQGLPAQDLLQRMCVLRLEMDAAALTTLRLLQPDGGVMAATPEAEAATVDLLEGLVKSDLLQDRYDESDCESRYILHPLMAETLQDIFEGDSKLLWRYAARMYSSRVLPHTEGTSYRYCIGLLGVFCGYKGDWDGAEVHFKSFLAHAQVEDAPSAIANALGVLGDIHRTRGDYDKAEDLYNQSLVVRTQLGDRAGMPIAWGVMGDIARKRGDYDKAEALYDQSLAVRTELGDRAGMATSWGVLGDIARNRGDYDKAEALYNQSLAVRTELGDRAGMASSWGVLGENELERGNLEAAETWLGQALIVFKELQMPDKLAELNWDLARLYRAKGDESQGQAYYSIPHGLYTKLGAKKELERIESEWNAGG